MGDIVEELGPGEFLYQADQELFLVCIANREDEIEFAVHGWRTIDKERLDKYLDAEKPVVHTEDQVRDVIDAADDPNADEKLDWLKDIFEQYKVADIEQDSAHSDFALDDT